MEPMSSFAEWKCGSCGSTRDVPTEELPHHRRRRVAWPAGWCYLAIGHFGTIACSKCVQKLAPTEAEARD